MNRLPVTFLSELRTNVFMSIVFDCKRETESKV